MNSQQIEVHRQRVEREIRAILRDEYGLTADMDTPVRYYLDFRTNRRLLELRDVLERMERGTFGICIMCGGSIPDVRLADSPVARLCDSCLPAPHSVMNTGVPGASRTHVQQRVGVEKG